ncbi:MAG: 50S ribosomal protein L29 [Candidatus Doudnabacteria bacterium]|nr:50S ribosomal protein L29 [Candidatus Doudnabacteria bacterium]
MSDQDLGKELAKLRERVLELRFKIGGKEVKNYRQMFETRKDVARILTVLKERQHVKSKA